MIATNGSFEIRETNKKLRWVLKGRGTLSDKSFMYSEEAGVREMKSC